MNAPALSEFDMFAEAFVRKYWETVKTGAFPMPPDEPVEETIEELLSDVSHQTELRSGWSDDGPSYTLRMMNSYGDAWLFTFRYGGRAWELVGASASPDARMPVDLLGPLYARNFEPFLRHVERIANDRRGI